MTTKSQSSANDSKSSGALDQNNRQSLHTLLEKGLKDIYSAEKHLVEALPEVAKATDDEDLEHAFKFHLEQTKKQVERLDKIFDRLHISRKDDEKCQAMEGLIQECKKVLQEFERSPIRDSALIIAAQKIEHYEIASYGSLSELADVLQEDKIADLLDRSLEEEEQTDRDLTDIAQFINDEAVELSEHLQLG